MSWNNNTNNNNNSSWTSPPQWAKEKPKTKDNKNNNDDDDDDQQQQQQQHAASTSSFSWSAWSHQPKDTFTNNPTKVDQGHADPANLGPVRPSNEKKTDAPAAAAAAASSSSGSTRAPSSWGSNNNNINNNNNNNNNNDSQQKQQLTLGVKVPMTASSEQERRSKNSTSNNPTNINSTKVSAWDNWVKQQTKVNGQETAKQVAEHRKQDEAQESWMAKVLLRREKLQVGESDASEEKKQKQPHRVMQHPHFIQRILKYTKITDYRVPIKLAHVSSSWEETIWHFGTVHLIWKKIFQASVEEVADDTIRSAKLKINQLHWKRKKEYYYNDVSGMTSSKQQLHYNKNDKDDDDNRSSQIESESSREQEEWGSSSDDDDYYNHDNYYDDDDEDFYDESYYDSDSDIDDDSDDDDDDDSEYSDDDEDDEEDDATDYSDDDSFDEDDRDELRTVIRELQRAKRRTNSTLAIDTTQTMHRSTYSDFLTMLVIGLDTLFSPEVDRALKYKNHVSNCARQVDEDFDETTTPEQRKEFFQAIDADFYGEVSCKRRLLAAYPVPPTTDATAAAAALAEKKAKEKALRKKARKSKKKSYCYGCGGYHTDSDEEYDDDISSDDDDEQLISDQYRDAVLSWCPPFALWNCRIDAAKMIPKLVELRHGFGERILLEGFFHKAFPDCHRYDANAEKRNAEDQETRTGNEHDEEVIFQRLLAEQQLKEDELSKKEKKKQKKEKVNDDDESSDDDDDDDASATSSSNSSSTPAFVGQESIFVVNVDDPDDYSLNESHSRQRQATNFGIIRAFLAALRSEPEIVSANDDSSENNNNLISFLPAGVPHVPSSAFTPTSSMKTRNRCRLTLVKAIHQKLVEISSNDRFDAEEVDNGDIVLFPASEYDATNEEEDEKKEDKEKKEKKKPLVNFFTHTWMERFCVDGDIQRGGYIFTSIIGQSSPAVFDFLLNCAFREFLWSDSRKKEQIKKFTGSSWSSSSAASTSVMKNSGNITINKLINNTTVDSTNENTPKAEFLASNVSHPELGKYSDPFSFSAEIRNNLGERASATTIIDPLLCSALSGNVEIFEHLLTTYPLLQQRFMFGSYDTLIEVFHHEGPASPTTHQQSRFTVKPYPFVPLSSYTNNKDNDGYAVSTEPRAPSREEESQKKTNKETMNAVLNSTRTNPYITLTFLKLVDLLERDIHKTVRDTDDIATSALTDKQTDLDNNTKLSAASTSNAGMTRQLLHYSSLLDPFFGNVTNNDPVHTRGSWCTGSTTTTSRQGYKNEMLLLDNSHYKRRVAQFQRIFDRIVVLAFQHDKRPALAMEPLFWREPLIAILLRLDPLISSQWVSAAPAEKICSNNRDNDDEPADSNNNTSSSNVFNRSKHKLSSSKVDNPDNVQTSTSRNTNEPRHEKFINFKVLRESVIDKLLNRLPLQTLVNCVIDLTKQFSNVCPTLLPLLQSSNRNGPTTSPSSSSWSVPSSSMESQRNTTNNNTASSSSLPPPTPSSSSATTVEERLLNTPDAFEKTHFSATTDIDPMERTCGFRTHIENKEPEVYDQVLLQQQVYNSSLTNVNTTTYSSLWPMSKKNIHFERRDPPREVSHLLLRLYRFLVNRLMKNSTEQEKAEVFDLSPSSINPLVQIFSSEYLNWNTLALVQIFFKHGKANPFIRRNLPTYPIHCESPGNSFLKGSVDDSMIPCYREPIIDQVGRCSLLHMLMSNFRFELDAFPLTLLSAPSHPRLSSSSRSTPEIKNDGATCFRLSHPEQIANERLVLRHNSMIHTQFLLEFIRLKYGDEKLQEYMIMPTEIEMNTPCHLGVMHFRPEILFVMRHQFRAPKINFTQLNKDGFAPLDCRIYGDEAQGSFLNKILTLKKLISKMLLEDGEPLIDRSLCSLLDDCVAVRFDGTRNNFIQYSQVFISSYESLAKRLDREATQADERLRVTRIVPKSVPAVGINNNNDRNEDVAVGIKCDPPRSSCANFNNNNIKTKLGGGWGYRSTTHCKW